MDCASFGTVIVLICGHVLRAARELDLIGSRRQRDRLAALAVDLGMEEEIRREPAAGRRINPPHPVAKDERGHRRPAVVVADVEDHGHRRIAREEDVDVAPETQVLRPLADVEADPRLALAGVAAVDLDDPVLEAQSGERTLERTVVEHGHIGPALDEIGGTDRRLRLGLAGRLLVDRSGVGAFGDQLGRDAGLVVNLDQEHRPAVLHQPGPGRALRAL